MKYHELTIEETISDITSSYQYCSDPNYIRWTAVTTPWRAKRVSNIMMDYFDKKAEILDVGSSNGLTISYTAQVFKNIQGIDIDENANKIARKRLKKLGLKTKISHYDGENLPFDDELFDGIVSTEVFEHVENRQLFIKELSRVLKPNGILIISSPNKLYPIDCEFHLPFLSYLPKKLADFYVKLSEKGLSYNGVSQPTYKEFKACVNQFFSSRDITFDLIKQNKKYFLNKERGNTVMIAASILKFLDKFDKTPLNPHLKFFKKMLLNMSAGWFLICKKN